jgi:aconitase A
MDLNTFKAQLQARLSELNDNEEGYTYYIGSDTRNYYPATQKIYLDAMEEGLLKTFIEAGAVVSTPTCGPCLGGYMGILAEHERCVSTTNRNFVGRMGHVESEIYLASPAVAAASAITGKLSGPDEVAHLHVEKQRFGCIFHV